MIIAMVGMGMRMRITEIVGVFVLVGVSVLGWRSLVRMDDVHPRFAQVALKRVRPRFVAIGTVLTRLLILVCARKIHIPTLWQANAAKTHKSALHVNARARLAFQNDLHS